MTNESKILDMVIQNNREIGEVKAELKAMHREKSKGYTRIGVFTGIGAMFGAIVSAVAELVR
jgi:hypothetical protein